MLDLWVPVIAALGSSILTGLAAFGFEWWRSARAGKAALAERRNRAYSLLLAPLELAERMRADLEPVYEAWSEVWTVGSKEAIIEANDLVDKCGDVMSA